MKNLVVAVLILAVLGAGVWFLWFRQPDNSAQYAQAKVSRGEVVVFVSASGCIRAPYTLAVRAARAGLVTAVGLEEGASPKPGQELFRIDNHPVFALGGRTPFYRVLATTDEESDDVSAPQEGDDVNAPQEGDDVSALQEMLKDLGFYEGELDGVYNDDTAEAVGDFLESKGEERTTSVGPNLFQAVGDETTVVSLSISLGAGVQIGTVVARVIPAAELEAAIDINEIDFASIELGQDVTLTLQALPGQTFTGKVAGISPGLAPAQTAASAVAAQAANGSLVEFLVTVSIDQPVGKMRSGMSVEARIILDRAENILTIPAAALRSEDDRDYVLLPVVRDGGTVAEEGETSEAEVAVGLRAEDVVEVRSGLAEGQDIIMGLDVDSIPLPSGGLFGGRSESERSGQGLGW